MSRRLALVFDFDLTLSPGIMIEPVLAAWGLDPAAFWDECAGLREQGYDLEHSYLARLTALGRERAAWRLDAARMRALGPRVGLYPGLSDAPGAPGLLTTLRERLPPGRLEVFIVSGGLRELILGCLAHHGLAAQVREVFACRMAEEDPGDGDGRRFSFPMETVNFTAKTQKLFAISKGSFLPDAPDVNAKVPPERLRVAMADMLYVGDGHSDVAAFALLRQFGGTSFAVHAPDDPAAERRARAYAVEEGRAAGWFAADYRPGSPLRQAILNWALERSGRSPQAQLDLP